MLPPAEGHRSGGTRTLCQWPETCHPTILADCLNWLDQAGFEVLETFGSRDGEPWSRESPRCLVWARRG